MQNKFLRTLGYTCGFLLLATCCGKLSAMDTGSGKRDEQQSGSVPHRVTPPGPEEGVFDMEERARVTYEQRLKKAQENKGCNFGDVLVAALLKCGIEHLQKTGWEIPAQPDDKLANPGQTSVSGSQLGKNAMNPSEEDRTAGAASR